ncbi:MAG TPA: hypothetical protein VKD67_11355, partial [Acidimicrobiales bacterium]|nr:hypothetical protein [Acidimicrobiales bacterium]
TYVALAAARVAAEPAPDPARRVVVPPRGRADAGAKAVTVARSLLTKAGFAGIEDDVAVRDLGLDVTFRARDTTGAPWLFELAGAFSVTRPGLKRADVLWRSLGKAAVLDAARRSDGPRGDLGPLVLLSTDAPAASSAGGRALRAVTGPGRPVHDVITLGDPAGATRLQALAGRTAMP